MLAYISVSSLITFLKEEGSSKYMYTYFLRYPDTYLKLNTEEPEIPLPTFSLKCALKFQQNKD